MGGGGGGGGGGGQEDYLYWSWIFFRLKLNHVYFFLSAVSSWIFFFSLDDIHVIKMIHTFRHI